MRHILERTDEQCNYGLIYGSSVRIELLLHDGRGESLVVSRITSTVFYLLRATFCCGLRHD